MNEYDFNKLYVSRSEIRLIKRLRRLKKVKYSEKYDSLISKGFAVYIHFSENEIGENIPAKDYIAATEKASAFIYFRNDSFFRGKLPVIISILSLIVSISSLVISILALSN